MSHDNDKILIVSLADHASTAGVVKGLSTPRSLSPRTRARWFDDRHHSLDPQHVRQKLCRLAFIQRHFVAAIQE